MSSDCVMSSTHVTISREGDIQQKRRARVRMKVLFNPRAFASESKSDFISASQTIQQISIISFELLNATESSIFI